MALLEVDDLATYFHTRNGIVRAVDGVSFAVDPGETLGIVGESGCGKSVTAYSLLGLIPQPPGRIERGTAVFDGVDLFACEGKALRGIRGKRISMIFQDAMTSLNPYLRISTQLIEPLLLHTGMTWLRSNSHHQQQRANFAATGHCGRQPTYRNCNNLLRSQFWRYRW